MLSSKLQVFPTILLLIAQRYVNVPANVFRVASTLRKGQRTAASQCGNGFGGMNVQLMNQWMRNMSQNTETMSNFLSTIQETERQLDGKMGNYDVQLARLDEKLNQMTSQIQWESSASKRILQFTEITKTEVEKLQESKKNNTHFSGRRNYPNGMRANFDDGKLHYLKEHLTEILNLIAQSWQDAHSMLDDLSQNVATLARIVISLRDSRQPLLNHTITTTFDTAARRIASSVRKQIYSTQENLDRLNSNLGNISHFGYHLRGGTDSIMNMEHLMNSINKISVKLLKKAREGCSEAKLFGGFGRNVTTHKKNTRQEKYDRDEEEYRRAQQATGPSWTAGGEMAGGRVAARSKEQHGRNILLERHNEDHHKEGHLEHFHHNSEPQVEGQTWETQSGTAGIRAEDAGSQAHHRSSEPYEEQGYGQNGETKLEQLNQNGGAQQVTDPLWETGGEIARVGEADGSQAHHRRYKPHEQLVDGQNEENEVEHFSQRGEKHAVDPMWETGGGAAGVGGEVYNEAEGAPSHYRSYEPHEEIHYGQNGPNNMQHLHQNGEQQAAGAPWETGGGTVGAGGEVYDEPAGTQSHNGSYEPHAELQYRHNGETNIEHLHQNGEQQVAGAPWETGGGTAGVGEKVYDEPAGTQAHHKSYKPHEELRYGQNEENELKHLSQRGEQLAVGPMWKTGGGTTGVGGELYGEAAGAQSHPKSYTPHEEFQYGHNGETKLENLHHRDEQQVVGPTRETADGKAEVGREVYGEAAGAQSHQRSYEPQEELHYGHNRGIKLEHLYQKGEQQAAGAPWETGGGTAEVGGEAFGEAAGSQAQHSSYNPSVGLQYGHNGETKVEHLHQNSEQGASGVLRETGDETAAIGGQAFGGAAGSQAHHKSHKPHEQLEYGQNRETKLEHLHQNGEQQAAAPSRRPESRITWVGAESLGEADGSHAHHRSPEPYNEQGHGQNMENKLEHSPQRGEQQPASPSTDTGYIPAEVEGVVLGNVARSRGYRRSHKSHEDHGHESNKGRLKHSRGSPLAVSPTQKDQSDSPLKAGGKAATFGGAPCAQAHEKRYMVHPQRNERERLQEGKLEHLHHNGVPKLTAPSREMEGVTAGGDEGPADEASSSHVEQSNYNPQLDLKHEQDDEGRPKQLHHKGVQGFAGPSLKTENEMPGDGEGALDGAPGSRIHNRSYEHRGLQTGDGQLEHSNHNSVQQPEGPLWEAGSGTAEVSEEANGGTTGSQVHQRNYKPHEELEYGQNEETKVERFHQNGVQQAVRPPWTTSGGVVELGEAAPSSYEHQRSHVPYDQYVNDYNDGVQLERHHYGAQQALGPKPRQRASSKGGRRGEGRYGGRLSKRRWSSGKRFHRASS